MRSKLATEMKQKVDDEDDRLAKAVAERDDKLAKEGQAKHEKELLARKSIHQHRIDTVSSGILRFNEVIHDSILQTDNFWDQCCYNCGVFSDHHYDKG